MAEIKLGRGWELAHSGHTWEQTGAAIFVQPLITILARTAELMLLAGAFQTAANVTGMVSLKVLAGVMYSVLSAHLYMTFWRYVVMPLNRTVRLRGTFLNLILILILSAALLYLCWFLLQQIVDASKHLVLVC
jgi:hypothetical protein